MNWIFPMAGYGKRSSGLGSFKPFIEVGGKKIYQHCIDGLKISTSDRVLCILSEETAPEYAKSEIVSYFESIGLYNVHVSILKSVPPGPALTVLTGTEQAVSSGFRFSAGPVHVVNIDQIISYQSVELAPTESAMPLYFNNLGSSCYVQLSDDFSKITSIREKEMISGHASSGAYLFGSIDLLVNSIEWGIGQENAWITSPGYSTKELFIGPCMNYGILAGWACYPLSTHTKIDLGSTKTILENEYSICKTR